jgi:AhpD family alkylhydroperoxidase
MTRTTLSQREKELIAVACSVSAGCQRCSDYHFRKVFEVGADLNEVCKAVADTEATIQHAEEMMQRKAYELMQVSREDVPQIADAADRITALVKLGAAVASNCTPTITSHLSLAQSSGATEGEIEVAIKLGKMVLAKAGQFADEAINESLASELLK